MAVALVPKDGSARAVKHKLCCQTLIMPAAGRCRACGLLALQLLLKELHVLEVAPLLLQLLLDSNCSILLLGTRCSVPVCCCLLPLLPGRCMPS